MLLRPGTLQGVLAAACTQYAWHNRPSRNQWDTTVEDWVHRALAKWPNVPAVYGWLSLDRRGRWLIRGEIISRPQIIDTINANYAADEYGCWYFQNGPQRGYMALEYTPLILRIDAREQLMTHTLLRVEQVSAAYLDEQGSVLLATEHGPGVLDDAALPWALERLKKNDRAMDEAALAAALDQVSGTPTGLSLHLDQGTVAVTRLDIKDAPVRLGFVRQPIAESGGVSV